MDLPKRLSWLRSGRFLRLASASTALVVLVAIIYNAAVVDRLPPTYVIRVSSTATGGQALTLTAIDIDFSKEVKPETAEAAFSISPYVLTTFHWQGQKLIVTPSAELPPSTPFHVHMAAGVQDKSGNTQGGTGDLDFTTVGPPSVTTVSPGPGAASVAVESPIQITFDRLMDPQAVVSGLKIEPSVGYQVSWKGAVMTITPSRPFLYGTEYKLTIGDPAVDTDGSRLPDYVTTFQTVGIGLRVTTLVPAADVAGVSIHSQIAVAFDGPIDPSSIAGAIKITPPVSGSTTVVALPDDRGSPAQPTATPTGPAANVLVFTPDSPLAAHTTYSVTMSPTVRGTNGQAAPQQAWTFITGEPPLNALNQIAFVSDRGGVANVWLMNPDGTNPRQVTWELSPVSGFDVSGDGSVIAYGTGGVVKKMSLVGDGLQTLTTGGDREYAPTFTPDGTGLVIARRDETGADIGYWRIPMISGADPKQVTTDGAPNPGSTSITGDGLSGQPGRSSWASRAAFSSDGSTMLLVRGSDGLAELVDMTGATPPRKLNIAGNSQPVWVQGDAAFYLAGTTDNQTWSYWRVAPDGSATSFGPAIGDIDSAGQPPAVVFAVRANDGFSHLVYSAGPRGSPTPITDDPAFSDSSPSFRPDGNLIVFGRVRPQNPMVSAGIWTVKPDGTGLTRLSADGAFPRWLP
ncbi:MAG: Ig-like domain-containing protein [Candidatus Limnocylindrales bacterium]